MVYRLAMEKIKILRRISMLKKVGGKERVAQATEIYALFNKVQELTLMPYYFGAILAGISSVFFWPSKNGHFFLFPNETIEGIIRIAILFLFFVAVLKMILSQRKEKTIFELRHSVKLYGEAFSDLKRIFAMIDPDLRHEITKLL